MHLQVRKFLTLYYEIYVLHHKVTDGRMRVITGLELLQMASTARKPTLGVQMGQNRLPVTCGVRVNQTVLWWRNAMAGITELVTWPLQSSMTIHAIMRNDIFARFINHFRL